MADEPFVSIIIRARDEEIALKRLLPILQSQICDFEYEIWLLDNGSRDATVALAQQYSLCYHFIPRDRFNYASALNLGAQLARGMIVVYLSAHCFPQGEYWLSDLIGPLRHNPDLAATYGRQSFDPTVHPFEAEGNDHLFPADAANLTIVAFSNANCAIRKEMVLKHPFNPNVKILEDHLLFLEISPYCQFKYVPDALVHHKHSEFSLRYYLQRWPKEGWAFHFITHHRHLSSQFKPDHFFSLQNVLGYLTLGYQLCARGRYKHGLLTLPFFLYRDILWSWGWVRGSLSYARTAAQDRDFLAEALRNNLANVVQSSQVLQKDLEAGVAAQIR
jgi:rhamnosyltransferase